MSGRRTRSSSRDAMEGITFGSFAPVTLADVPIGTRPVTLTDQASARAIQPEIVGADEVMG